MQPVSCPINPQTVAVGAAAVNFAALKQAGAFRLFSSCDSFYLISASGTSASANGNTCHFLPANQALDLLASPGEIVSIIANGAGSGNAYLTEWA